MNRKYYFNNMWWGWVTGGYMLYMSWDYDFKYRLLFWCISLCGMVLYPVAKWYIEDTALKFTRPDFWNSVFFADTPGKMGLLAMLANPDTQSLRRTANLWSNGTNCRPL
ncbi:Colicin-Ia immunity protein [Shigella sonnei]|nr:colicin E1 family microcin immunity protein [Shigella sonnei]CTC94126.1 Colicin-Ia immunity protein [Shigella sonnei]